MIKYTHEKVLVFLHKNLKIAFICPIKKSFYSYIKTNKIYANGAINKTLSILSNIPPCPGNKLL